MKTSSHQSAKPTKRPVKSAVPKKTSKRATPKKAAAQRARAVTSNDAVALAVGRALMRKPRVNSALLKAFQANRDLFAR